MNKKVKTIVASVLAIIGLTVGVISKISINNEEIISKSVVNTTPMNNYFGNTGNGTKISVTKDLIDDLDVGHTVVIESDKTIDEYTNEDITLKIDVTEYFSKIAVSIQDVYNSLSTKIDQSELQMIITGINHGYIRQMEGFPELKTFKLIIKDDKGTKEEDLSNEIKDKELSTQLKISENCDIGIYCEIHVVYDLYDAYKNVIGAVEWDDIYEFPTDFLKINQIDKTVPTIKISPDGAASSASQKVKIEVEDNESGLSPNNIYQYQLGTSNTTPPTGTWNNYTSGTEFSIGEGLNGDYYLWVKTVEDSAGNKSSSDEYTVSSKYTFTNKQAEPIEINDYTVKDYTIQNVKPNTSLEELKKHIVINDTQNTKILGKGGKELQNSDIITTGSKIQVKENNETKEYKIIVKGDANGDGLSDINDILIINKHRLNKAKIEGDYFLASDINADNKVDINDILQINKFRLGKIASL